MPLRQLKNVHELTLTFIDWITNNQTNVLSINDIDVYLGIIHVLRNHDLGFSDPPSSL